MIQEFTMVLYGIHGTLTVLKLKALAMKHQCIFLTHSIFAPICLILYNYAAII